MSPSTLSTQRCLPKGDAPVVYADVRMLGVSKSGFYDRRIRSVKRDRAAPAVAGIKIKALFQANIPSTGTGVSTRPWSAAANLSMTRLSATSS